MVKVIVEKVGMIEVVELECMSLMNRIIFMGLRGTIIELDMTFYCSQSANKYHVFVYTNFF